MPLLPRTEAELMTEIIPAPVPIVLKRSEALDEEDWKVLLRRIRDQRCTPFLGPETCFDFSVRPASVLAEEWADEYEYPFEDRKNLPRVAQFVAYKALRKVIDVKEKLAEKFHRSPPPDFSNPNEPYSILASLPLKVYINTHYFAFMWLALKSKYKDAQRVVCRWNDNDSSENHPDLPAGYDPKPDSPLVFHMFGYVTEPESLVLTEDDYLDFLVRTSVKQDLIPQAVQSAMKNNSLLFFGYQPNDLDFRVITRTLYRIWQYRPSQRGGYTIQFIHVGDEKLTPEQIALIKKYCNSYCDASMSIGVYWGSTREFMTELRQRWEEYCVNNRPC
jgi:hypothetical protein